MEEKLKTGTTIVGIKIQNAVVLASDRQGTMGNIAIDLEAKKLHKINNKIALGIAGSMGDALTVIRFLKSHAKLFEIEREIPFGIKAASTFLSNILNSNRYFPYIAAFIIGGFNEKPELYATDVVGGMSEVESFTSLGSGFQLALGKLEESYKQNMTEQQAIELAKQAIRVAKKRDVYTGADNNIQVIVITKQGVKELNEKETQTLTK